MVLSIGAPILGGSLGGLIAPDRDRAGTILTRFGPFVADLEASS